MPIKTQNQGILMAGRRQKKGQTANITKKPVAKVRRISRAAIFRILDLHAGGMTLKKACEIENLDRSNVWNWLQLHEPQRYARARQLSAHAMVDAINDKIESCIDPEQAQLLRIKLDVVKWTASKVDPATYGDKQTVAISGNDERIVITEGHFIVRDSVDMENVIIVPALEGEKKDHLA